VSSNAPAQPEYRPDIDGLRAVAVVSVIGFHAFPPWFRGGFIGVDIFFVISGFLITSILHKSLARGQFTLLGFYSRRIKRIFPALILVLAAIAVFVGDRFLGYGGTGERRPDVFRETRAAFLTTRRI
jgi:peptidoglycan/LPS O-acetylase OafA/YrhL